KGTKWGLRGRTTIAGYDLSINYVKDESIPVEEKLINSQDKIGLSLKGDLGPIGAYTAVSYEPITDNDDQYIYQIGLDYSKIINYSQRAYFQGEVLNLRPEKLEGLMGELMENSSDSDIDPELPGLPVDDRLNLFFGNISYSLNNFSELGLMLAASLDDESFMLSPRYSNQLPGQLTVEIGSYYLQGEDRNLFNSKLIPIQLSFSYPF
ncbi:MAG: hypothetical protein ACOCZR_03455, partial [Halanaerobiales bacterium]